MRSHSNLLLSAEGQPLPLENSEFFVPDCFEWLAVHAMLQDASEYRYADPVIHSHLILGGGWSGKRNCFHLSATPDRADVADGPLETCATRLRGTGTGPTTIKALLRGHGTVCVLLEEIRG